MTSFLLIGRHNPYFIIVYLLLILLVSLPFLLLGKKRKSLYPNNENISKKLRDFLMGFHFVGSIIIGIGFTKLLQYNSIFFEELYKENNKLIPLTAIILTMISSIIIGILIEIFTRGIKQQP